MLLFLILCSSIATSWAQRDDVNNMLEFDRNFHGPGVKARVTSSGVHYVSAVVADAFATHFADVRPPQGFRLPNLRSLPSISLSNPSLATFQLSRDAISATTSHDTLHFSTNNISMSINLLATGQVLSTSLRDPISVRSSNVRLEVDVRILRNSIGNPALEVAKCNARSLAKIMMSLQKKVDPQVGKSLADSIAMEADQIFANILCPKVEHIVQARVNQRFQLLTSKISLEETKNFDIVRNILQAEERIKRIARQNAMRHAMRRRVVVGRKHLKAAVTYEDDRMSHSLAPIDLRWQASDSRLVMRSRRAATRVSADATQRSRRQEKFHLLLNTFNFSRANAMMLDYGMLTNPVLSERGIEIATSGEVFITGNSTPFGARPLTLPPFLSTDMLQIAVSDFVPNSLMYHGHRSNLFNTRVDWRSPQFGSVMRTSCDLSTGSLFCVGDLFPTLRDMLPDKRVAFLFSTVKAPAVIVKPESQGGIKFSLLGRLDILSEDEKPVGSMQIRIEATMRMRLTSKSVKGRVLIDDIKLTSLSPRILVQEELDDAGFLSREILQRMVNDILKQGIPIPIHPLFKLVKPKLVLGDRSMYLETNFQLNEHIIRQLTAENLG